MSAMTAEDPVSDLPLVTGQHRNHVLAARRRDRAVQLATEGMTYQQIADHLGYANRGTVHRIVQQALQRHEADDVDFCRTVTLSRLDALLSSLWPKIEQGDVRAVMAVLRVEDMRCRLLDLFPNAKRSRPRAGHGRCGKPNTVVVHRDCMASNCPDHWPADARPPL